MGTASVKVERKGRRGRSSKPTAADVAELAQVSRATVSRTFTPGSHVDGATRERILEAALRVGYRVDEASAAFARESEQPFLGGTVGLVMGDLDNPFYNCVLTLFLDRLHQRGLRALCRTAVTLESSEREVRTMLRYGVDALVIASSGLKSSSIAACRAAGVPVVLFNRHVADAEVASVQTDNIGGGRVVADLLACAGHRRMAFINGLEGASTNQDRRAGFSMRLAELGIEPPLQEYGEYTYAGGREAVKRLMLAPDRPDGIFCANDICALGAMDGLRSDLRLEVPRDVSVVGFDDIPMAAWPSFNLTTVRQRRNQMVREAMTLLDRFLEDPASPPETVTVTGRLIVRGSTRLPSPAAAEPMTET